LSHHFLILHFFLSQFVSILPHCFMSHCSCFWVLAFGFLLLGSCFWRSRSRHAWNKARLLGR
jgi:hypothetical protein